MDNPFQRIGEKPREALVIWVPPGAMDDSTRSPKQMDETAVYLRQCGVRELLIE